MELPKLWKIHVRGTTGETFSIDTVGPQQTIEQLKLLIEQRNGIHPDRQRIVFNGKLLSDAATVEESGIQDGSTINLVYRIRV